jgi:hypothetical protein
MDSMENLEENKEEMIKEEDLEIEEEEKPKSFCEKCVDTFIRTWTP